MNGRYRRSQTRSIATAPTAASVKEPRSEYHFLVPALRRFTASSIPQSLGKCAGVESNRRHRNQRNMQSHLTLRLTATRRPRPETKLLYPDHRPSSDTYEG